MPGNRMSILPQAQRCGQSARLSSGVTRVAALVGTAWHAHNLQPDSDAARVAVAKLSPEERAEVLSWKKPTDIETPHGWLRYDHAWTEKEVALNLDGESCDPADSACVTVGHVDMFWILGKVMYVADAKRSEWTTADGPESLQLHAYAMALASMHDCTSYVTGIWGCIEGRWWWADRAVCVFSEEADMLRQLIVAAATNTEGSYVVGSHCRSCYGRERCPAWLLPPELADTELGGLTSPDGLDNASALRALVAVQRIEDTAKKAKEILKEWSLAHGGIVDDSTGKRWAGIKMPGRESLDVGALKRAGIPVDDYMRKGPDYSQLRWMKA